MPPNGPDGLPKPVADATLETAVSLEQDRILHQNLALAAGMAMGVAVLLAVVFIDAALALQWLVYMSAVLGARLLGDRLYWQSDPSPSAARRWRRMYTLGAWFTGLGWSVAAPLFIAGADAMHQTFGVLILVGVAAGAVPVMSARISLYVVYATLVILPVSLTLFAQPQRLLGLLGFACLLLMATLIRSVHAMSSQLMQMVRQRVELDQAYHALEQAHVKMEEAVVMAQYANRAKSAFLANMSHEIRTPLNAVLGFAQIGVRDSLGRKTDGYFRHILGAGQHLLGVINDILDFSKLEAGKLEVESQPFRLTSAIDEAMLLVAERAQSKGLVLSVKHEGELSDWVVGDALRLKQVLVNLLANAVKFTEQGAVSLTLSPVDEVIRFRVDDSGIGMSAAQIEHLFTAFEQADSSITRRFGGSGLGLTISRRLARMMGGDIDVASQPGVGSSFTLTLPLPASAPGDESCVAAPLQGRRLQGLRILVAEDLEVNRAILENMLVHEGAVVTFAENGQQAIECLQAQGLSAFDVVLMDVQMPVMDGYAATRGIRALTRDLPIIGLTAHAMAEEKSRCLAVGMAQHVAKPIDINVLVGAILNQVQRGTVVVDSAAPTEVTAHDLPEASGAVIDWAGLKTQFKPAFVDRLVQMVLNNHQDTPEKIRSSLARRDFHELGFIAHSLKGIGGNIMAARVFDLGKRTNDAAQAENAEALILGEQLAQSVEALLAEMSRYASDAT